MVLSYIQALAFLRFRAVYTRNAGTTVVPMDFVNHTFAFTTLSRLEGGRCGAANLSRFPNAPQAPPNGSRSLGGAATAGLQGGSKSIEKYRSV